MSAQRLDAKARKVQRDKDLLVMQKIAGEYNKSASIFNQKGSQAFVDSLPDSIFINEQRSFFIKELKGIYELPLLEVTDSQLLIKDSDTTFKMPIDQVLDGIFVFNDGALLYDFNRDVIYNIESWKDQTKKAGKSAYLNWLQFLFIPQAEAKFKLGMGTVIGALLGGLLGAWIGNYFDKKKQEAAESSAAAHAEKVQREGAAKLAPVTPPPIVPETQVAKDKDKDDKKGEDKDKTDPKNVEDDKKKKDDADAFSDEKIYEQLKKAPFNVSKDQITIWKTTAQLDGYPDFAVKVLNFLLKKKKEKTFIDGGAEKWIKLLIFNNRNQLGPPENVELLEKVKKVYNISS